MEEVHIADQHLPPVWRQHNNVITRRLLVGSSSAVGLKLKSNAASAPPLTVMMEVKRLSGGQGDNLMLALII